MFTGLIQCIGRVQGNPQPLQAGGQRLQIDLSGWSYQPSLGASIAVNGCCLTVAAVSGEIASFDVIRQTLDLTTLGSLTPNDAVNLEHATTPETLLGGHLVQGHVDTVGEVEFLNQSSEACRCRIQFDRRYEALLVPQGSVTVDGVSLTIADLGEGWFEVALIPTTLVETTFGQYAAGDGVNLEWDVIAKMVERQMAARAGN
jgi:riboflavin synthase